MATRYLRNIALSFQIFTVLAQCYSLNYSGEALTTRYWDCCKPSCGWKGKADVSSPVGSCSWDDQPIDINAGTGCNGGTAFQCSDQQPWAVNETFAYGFAGAFLLPSLTHGGIEASWCCACYQLDFTSEPLIGKSLVVQVSNTAYDVTTTNRFTLAIPGGNLTAENACAQHYNVSKSVFGQDMEGVASRDDCQNLPTALQPGCQWRFDWFQDASSPSANFKRVVCPTNLTAKTGCVRDDDTQLKAQLAGQTSFGDHTYSLPSTVAMSVVLLLYLLST